MVVWFSSGGMGVGVDVGAVIGVGAACVGVSVVDANSSGGGGKDAGSGLTGVDTIIWAIMAIQSAPFAPGSTNRNPSGKV